jgi:hypothetical protein
MLLHSALHAIYFLAGLFLIRPLQTLPLNHPLPHVAPSPIAAVPPSPEAFSPDDRSYQSCMAAFDTLAAQPTNLGNEPRSDAPDEILDPSEWVGMTETAQTETALTPNAEPVLTAPGIALYRQIYQDDRDNQDVDDVHGMSIEADGLINHHNNHGDGRDRATTQATTLIYRLDLSQGAQLDLAGMIAIDSADSAPHLTAAYDTQRDPHVPPRSLDDHWQAIRAAHPDRAFAAINGQFFGSTPIRLAFPVKAQGEIISGGYAGSGEYAGEKMMFAITDQTATIAPFPELGRPDSPLFSTIPDLIVGLHPCADKGRDRAVGRTFLGIADRTGDGRAETVLILVASHATQTDAILTLQRFGAISAVMLDGGGSTQAIALGQTYVTSSDQHPRAIPHAIGILSGTDITHNLEL